MSEDRFYETSLCFWNARAISLVQQGNCSGAILLFQQCLQTLGSHGQFSGNEQQRDHVAHEINSVPVVALEENSVDIVSLFPRAFLMTFPVLEDFENCSRILLYNMALACDIQASLLEVAGDPLSASQWADRAINVYCWALSVAYESSCDLGGKTLAEVVALAATNNLGRLQSRLGFFEEARACVLRSLEIFNRVWRAGHGTNSLPYESLAPFIFLGQCVLPNAPAA